MDYLWGTGMTTTLTDERPYRSLWQVSRDELTKAIGVMIEELEIYGSGRGYDLYVAINKEYESAIENQQRYENALSQL